MNLIALDDLPRLEERHIADSLRVLPLLAGLPDGPCADVGSGAGLPGIPLAIAGPARPWRLIEPRRRRAAFLEEVVRTLELDCEIVVQSAEQAAELARYRAAHAFTVARAVAEPSTALGFLTPLTAPGGMAAAFMGAGGLPPPGAEVPLEGIAIVRVGSSDPEASDGEPGKS